MKTVLVLPPAADRETAALKLARAAAAFPKALLPDTLWLPGTGKQAAAGLPVLPGIGTVLCGGHADGSVPKDTVANHPAMLDWLCAQITAEKPDCLFFASAIQSVPLATQLAYKTGLQCVTGAVEILPSEAVLGGQAEGGFAACSKAYSSCLDWVQPLHIDTTGAIVVLDGGAKTATPKTPPLAPAIIEEIPLPALPNTGTELLELQPAAGASPLESAKLVFVGGRGLRSKATCDLLRETARRYGGVAGFTRPAAMNGWCGLDEIIGQSGCSITPEVCVTVGVSGAAAFMAGIRGAKTLVCFNTDGDAPIFQYADHGAIADAEEILAALDAAVPPSTNIP